MTQITPLTGEINFVIDYFWNGCRTPFTLYCKTSLPVAGEVALVLLGVDMQDIVTSFFRPKGLRSARHGRKSAKRRRFQGVPQITDLIAERVPGIEDFAARRGTDGTEFWWKMESQIERVTWTVALIELTHDFAYKSLLGVMKLKETKCAVAGRAMASGQMWEMFNNGAAYLVDLQTVEYVEYPCRVEHSVIYFDDDKSYQVMVECTAFNKSQYNGDIDIQIWILATVGGGIFSTGPISVGPGSTTTKIGCFLVKGPGAVRIEQASHGAMTIASCTINVVPSWIEAY